METAALFVLIVACVLAFANGANDNAKGVATLIGSRTLSMRRAIWLAAIATLAGSVASAFFAHELVVRFSGKGIVDAALVGTNGFLICVGLAAGVTVLLATRLGMPVSTTHALVGAIGGVGLAAGGLHTAALLKVFFLPLVVSPLIAIVAAGVLYPLLRFARQRLGVTGQTCVCIDEQYHPVEVRPDGTLVAAKAGLTLRAGEVPTCRRYDGQIAGVSAQRVLDASHVLSAAAISFARGLNDTPKIAGLLVAVALLPAAGKPLLLGLLIAAGGLLAVRRVARTMSFEITDINDGQAFSANIVTALLVVLASRFGVPVSATHVSCGSLFGIGLVTGQAHRRTIGQILAAWVLTLPAAAAGGWLVWQLVLQVGLGGP